MSKSRTEMKNALRSLDVSKPLRIPPQLGFSAPKSLDAARSQTSQVESNVGQRGSKMDSVQNEQCPNLTESKMNSVQNGPSRQVIIGKTESSFGLSTESKIDPVQNEHRPKFTESNLNTVHFGPCEKRTGSKMDPVTVSSTKGFTKVPHSLLRMTTPFSEPIDFMIYMHLFTYSYGWDRSTASMGLNQLERYTRAGRNTVKRSLERLITEGWIECIEEYEHSRMSRKWKVRHPDAAPKDPAQEETTGSKMDTVQIGQSPEQTLRGSKMDSVTGSILDPFIEHSPKELPKNSLSRVGAREGGGLDQPGGECEEFTEPVLRDYFGSKALAPRKRQSEFAAFCELREGYPEQSIALCVEYLAAKGLPSSGEPCHSPMAFLSRAMGEVLALASERDRKRSEATDRVRVEEMRAQEAAAHAERAEVEFRAKEQAFIRAFPDAEMQEREIGRLAAGLSPFIKDPAVVRRIVIGGWVNA